MSIIIPYGVTSIDYDAFSGCSKLMNITIPDSVTSIGGSAFSDCSSLVSIIIPYGVTSIGSYAFSGCSSMTSINIPNSVTSIGGWAFNGCSSLASINIPSSVTSIEGVTFLYCSSLSSITIPDSVTSIGPRAFEGCSSLVSIDIPNSVTSIDGWAFNGCSSLTSINIPSSVTSIESGTFLFCSSLSSITIPDSVTSIGGSAFSDCNSLMSIIIPHGVTSINQGLFEWCNSLTSINIPDSVTNISNYAFLGCSSLTDVYYGGTEEQWSNIVIGEQNGQLNSATKHYNGITTFGYCGDEDDGTNLTWTLDSDGLLTISGKGRMADYFYYDSVAPWKAADYSAVIIEDGVTSIGDYSFYEAPISSLVLPKSVQVIGESAFGWSNLVDITLSSGLTSIGEACFMGSKVPKIIIPSTVNSLKKASLADIEEIYFEGDAIELTDDAQWLYYGPDEGRNIILYYKKGTAGWTDSDTYDANTGTWNGYTLKAWGGGGLSESSRIPVNSSDESQILDATLSQVDMENLLPEITSGMDKLRGPSITIAGKTFYLFEITSKLEVDLGKKGTLQLKVDYEKKTVNVLCGYKPIVGSTTIVGDPNSGEKNPENLDFWKAYTDAKSLYKMTVGDTVDANNPRFRSKFQDVYDELQAFEMDMIINATGKICGYLEFSYETGEVKLSEGGILLSVSVKATQNGRIPSFPAAYLTLRFETSADGKIRAVFNDNGAFFDPAFDAELKTAIGVGLGDNTGKFQAYIEGGFDGDLGAHVRTMGTLSGEDPFSVDMTGNLYFSWKLKAWLYEDGDTYKKELFKLGLYPRLELLTAAVDFDHLTMENFLASASPISREYLNSVSVMSISDDYTFSKVEYPFSEPTLIHLNDGRMLMVWVGDSGIKADGDRTSIYYSLYSGGTWSTPAIVHENGTYNDHPVLYQDGNMVYMVWMRADTALDGMSVEDALSHMDLAFSAFDGNIWSEPEIVSQVGNGLTAIDYAITASNGVISVVWLENSLNDLLMTSGENSIHQRTRENGDWDSDFVIFETTDVITGLDACRELGLQITYSITSNNNTVTYLRKSNGMIVIVDGANHEAKWIGGKLYELRDTTLYCDGSSTGLDGLTNYEIISSETQTVALTLVPTGFTCELYGNYYDAGSGTWGPWTQLTNFNQYIRSYSAVLDESGKIVAALNLVDADSNAERVYDNTSAMLVVVDDCRYADLVVSEWLTYDDSLIIPDAVVPISFQVTNNSLETLTQISATVNGQTQLIPCDVAPGESSILTTFYQLPSNICEHTIILTATPSYSGPEANTTNNSASTVVGLADLVITVSAPESDKNAASVTADISNQGYADAKNVTLTVYRSNMEGNVLYTKSLGTIEAGSNIEVAIPLPTDMLFLNDPNTMHALNFEVISESNEQELANNGDRVAFGNILPLQVCPSVSEDSVKLSVSVKNEQESNLVSTLLTAVYAKDGKLLTVQTNSVQTEIGVRSKVDFAINRSQYADEICIKVFWIRQNSYTPITLVWEQNFFADG